VTFVDFFGWAFLPFNALWLIVVISLSRDPQYGQSHIVTRCATLALLIPFYLIVRVFNDRSLLIRMDEQIYIVAFGLLLAALPFFAPKKNAVGSVFLMLVGGGLATHSAWNLIEDFARPREQVIGFVERAYITSDFRGIKTYKLQINNKTYPALATLFNSVHEGDAIRADVGRGSGMILAVTELPFQTTPTR
jgi:hypothetical protein